MLLEAFPMAFRAVRKNIWLALAAILISFFMAVLLLLDISIISQNMVKHLSDIVLTMETNPSAFLSGSQDLSYAMSQLKILMIWLTATVPVIFIFFSALSVFFIHKVAGNKPKFWSFTGRFSLITLIFYLVFLLIAFLLVVSFFLSPLIKFIFIFLFLLLFLLLFYFYLIFISMIPGTPTAEIIKKGFGAGTGNFKNYFTLLLIFLFLILIFLLIALFFSRINSLAGFLIFSLLIIPSIVLMKLLFFILAKTGERERE